MGIDSNIKILLSSEEIEAKVSELADAISKDYYGKELLLLGVLKGSVIFLSDIVRKIAIPVDFDFVAYSSYGDSILSAGDIEVLKDINKGVKKKHVLIVEDIIDTGLTLSITNIVSKLIDMGAESVKICTLLDKPSNRTLPVSIDYCGFKIRDEFVFGYGMDYKHKYRSLPYIGYFSC